ncbi:MAG: tRNA 2-thiouridine(34) synthase MnmA [Candidatus Omnitrophica bacterium]|nr:tRNA 2-thiouridine(34) synthase MnmA [Candidatus Omnitrophota bacterium]
MPKKKVVVAMSGGVDSSVCAALLKDQGFQAIGITMQIWPRAEHSGGCCGIESIADAKKVADQLDIPHYVLNFRQVFKEKVIANFCREYQRGRTPNPCIRCNQYIKFKALLTRARQLGADYIATGHYARIEFSKRRNKFLLKKGIDRSKDQSYFLFRLNQTQLKHSLFPLGEFTKDRVRKIAQEKKLPVAKKSASQEICFIPDNNYVRFVKKHFPQAAPAGPIVNTKGETIGTHQGIIFYTVGQRKGIGIAAPHPLYVSSIEPGTNTIVVGKKEDVLSDELLADNVHFIYLDNLKAPLKVEAKVRYLHPAAPATLLVHQAGRVKVKFRRPQWAVTPGQAVVFYQGDIVVGGGTISGNN